jgi:hypothetical protein
MSHGDYLNMSHDNYFQYMPQQTGLLLFLSLLFNHSFIRIGYPSSGVSRPHGVNRYVGINQSLSGAATSLIPGSGGYESCYASSHPSHQFQHPASLLSGYPATAPWLGLHHGCHYQYQPQEYHRPAAGLCHGPPLDDQGGQAHQNGFLHMDSQNNFQPQLVHSQQIKSRTDNIPRVSVIRRNPVKELYESMEDLDDQNEAALETMKNYSTQVFMDGGEDDSYESDEEFTETADYNSSWFDESFAVDDIKTTTPEDAVTNSSEDDSSHVIDHLNLKVAMLEEQLSKCEADKNYLLAVRDMDFARYLDLERQQRRKADWLQDELDDLKDENLELHQKLKGETFSKIDEGRIIVSGLLSDVLFSISTVMERSSKQLEIDDMSND